MTEKGKLGAVVFGLIVSLVMMLCVVILPAAPVSAGNTVGMVLDPTPVTVTVNGTFSVDITVTISGGEEVCEAEAHIDFDPTYLEVVSIEAGTALPIVMSSTFNNTAGTIDYTAGATTLNGTEPTMDFTLATVNLKAKAMANATPTLLTFVYISPLRVTEAQVGHLGSGVPPVASLDHSAVINGSVTINAAAVSWLEVSGNATMIAGGSNELTITAKDEYDNVATGYSGMKNLTFSGPGTAPSGQPATVEGIPVGSATQVHFTSGVSDANVATLTAYKAETTAVDVTDGSINSTGYDLDLTVSAAAASRLEVTGSAAMTAGSTNELTIRAKDQYGNIATSYTGTKNLTFSGPGTAPSGQQPTVEGIPVGSATPVHFTSGVSDANAATLTAYKAETTTVDVSDGSINSFADPAYDLDLTVNAAAASTLVVSGITDPVKAGTVCSVTVTAVDAYNNTDTTYAGTIHFTSSDDKATLPGNYTFVAGTDNGSHTFTSGVILETAGEQSVTATDTATTSITGYQTVTVTGAAKGTNWGTIIGGIIGGLLVIGIIVYLLWGRKRA